MGKDHYLTLGVTKTASKQDIQKAFRRLSLKFHPEKNNSPDAEAKFYEVAEAYDVLCNSERKARYDKFGEEGLKGGVPTAENVFLDGYTFHGDAKRVFKEFFGGDNPFADLFNFDTVDSDGYSSFGGLKGRSQPKQDLSIERDLALTLEEVFNGCIKKMKISRKVLNDDGRTTSTREKILTIIVKKGWSEGTKVTFPKEGDQGPNIIPADITFELKDKPHPLFKRDGINLVYRAQISLLTALTGGAVEIITLDGRKISVPINEIISEGQCKRVVGEGMPKVDNPEERGDLMIVFHVLFPKKLKPEQKYLIKQALGSSN